MNFEIQQKNTEKFNVRNDMLTTHQVGCMCVGSDTGLGMVEHLREVVIMGGVEAGDGNVAQRRILGLQRYSGQFGR